jgi:hypothetical protein
MVGAPFGTTPAAFELGKQPKMASISSFTGAPSTLARITVALPAARSGPRFGPGFLALLAGYENLTAPLFALALQCKTKVTVSAPRSSPKRRTLDRRALSCGP